MRTPKGDGRPAVAEALIAARGEGVLMALLWLAAGATAVVYGADDPKGGAVVHGPRFFEQPTCHWRPKVEGGMMAPESSALLKRFFQARRKAGAEACC